LVARGRFAFNEATAKEVEDRRQSREHYEELRKAKEAEAAAAAAESAGGEA
jgi:hypothetical protein